MNLEGLRSRKNVGVVILQCEGGNGKKRYWRRMSKVRTQNALWPLKGV